MRFPTTTRLPQVAAAVVLFAWPLHHGWAAQLKILHDLAHAPGNGAHSRASLTPVGSTLFGTSGGGTGNFGTIFAINTDGSDFHLVHQFAGGPMGSDPISEVTAVGSKLFGTTKFGGTAAAGTIYSVNMDGSDFQVLHSFASAAGDGRDPLAGLTAVGPTLFGTTFGGGATNSGTIFKIDTDGSDYQVVHSFGTTITDGRGPAARLTLSGNPMYGTAEIGGSGSAPIPASMSMVRPPLRTTTTFSAHSSTSGGRNMSSNQAARTPGSALWPNIAPGSESTPSLITSTSISPTSHA